MTIDAQVDLINYLIQKLHLQAQEERRDFTLILPVVDLHPGIEEFGRGQNIWNIFDDHAGKYSRLEYYWYSSSEHC